MQNSPLSNNFKNRLSRIYVAEKSFKNDSGENVNYERLVIEVAVKDEVVSIEYKLDKKDKLILSLSDVIDEEKAF